ncbi:MAG: sigma-70 family RNA polymerase sigma factor [Ginsengibacter sp.]
MAKSLSYDIKNLLLQVGKGNELAFKAVIDFYKERFYAASLKMTHADDIAEEIVQEVFVNLWIKRVQVAATTNPEGYLFAMLHNSIYAHFRKLALEKAMKKKIGQQFVEIDSSPIEEVLFAKEDREIFEAVINQLPSQQRIVYKLSKQQGLSRQQIAGQLHISPHTVKNHLQQAIRFIGDYYKAGAAFIWVAILQWL